MATLDERFEAAATKAEDASEIGREWANGDATTTITTESGPLPSLAKFLSDNSTQIDTNNSRITTIENQNLDTRLTDEELETTIARAEQKLINNAVVYLNFTEDEGFQHNDLSVTRGNATGLINYTCSTTATGQTADGGIVEVSAGSPRIVWNEGKAVGLLSEPSKENKYTASRDFSDAAWNKVRVSVQTDAEQAPDGTMTADKIVENTDDAPHQVNQVFVYLPETQYSFTFYAKAAERSQIAFVPNSDDFQGYSAIVSLLDGGIVSGSSTAEIKVIKLKNEWFKITITDTSLTSPSGQGLQVRIADNGQISYQGDGSSGIYLWQAQLEEGLPTSDIFTTASPAVRDDSKADLTVDYNSDGFLAYVECEAFGGEGFGGIFSSGLDTNNRNFDINQTPNGQVNLGIRQDGTYIISNTSDSSTAGKYAIMVDNNVAYAFANGELIAQGSFTGILANTNQAGVGYRPWTSGAFSKAHIKEAVISSPMSVEEAIALTTLGPEA